MKGNIYRDCTCGQISKSDIGKVLKLAGWVENIRDHGGVMFIDLRDQYGVSQIVIHDETMLKNVHRETVISVMGKVIERDEDTINLKI